MRIITLPVNIIELDKGNITLSNTIGQKQLSNIIRSVINESIESKDQINWNLIKAVRVFLYKEDFEYMMKSDETDILLKEAKSWEMIYDLNDNLSIVSDTFKYNKNYFSVKPFYYSGTDNKYLYDINKYLFKRDYYNGKIEFGVGNIVYNSLDNMQYLVARNPEEYSINESLIPINLNSSGKSYLESYKFISKICDYSFVNIKEYFNAIDNAKK